MTTVALLAARELDHRNLQLRFEDRAALRIRALRRVIDEHRGSLVAISALFDLRETVGREDFARFVSPLLREHEAIQALAWAPRVARENRDAYEQAAREEGLESFRIWERAGPDGAAMAVADREEYVPVYFIEPSAGNEQALGFDLASDGTRLVALQRARDTRELTCTARLKLVQEGADQHSVLFVIPHVARRERSASGRTMPGRHLGYFTGVFRMTDVLETAFAGIEPGGIDVLLTDITHDDDQRDLAFHASRLRNADEPVTAAEVAAAARNLRRDHEIQIGGRVWRITCGPSPQLIAAAASFRPVTVLVVGFVITGLLAGYLFVLARRREIAAELLLRDRAVECASCGVVLTDARRADHPVVYVNRAFERITGYTKEEMIDRSCRFLQADDRDPAPTTAHQDACRQDREARAVLRSHRKDGSLFWNELSVAPVKRADGVTTHHVGILNDITERMHSEELLRHSEERYRTLVEHAPEGIVVLDPKSGRFVDANEQAVRLFGLTRSELLRVGPVDVSPPIQPDGTPTAVAARRVVESALAGDTPVFEWMHHDSRGIEIPCEVRLDRLPTTSGHRVRGTVTDITDRKKSEERQRFMMRELDHRVKNNLAAVLALIEQTVASASSVDDFRESLVGRIRALARTHEAMAATSWKGASLHEIVRLNLDAFVCVGEGRVSIQGEEVTLPTRASPPLCMAIHELTTNAAKYGSLSRSLGRVEVKWWRRGVDGLDLRWVESGGPIVDAPSSPGFGTQLIIGFIEHELGGEVDLKYKREGLECTISLPGVKR